MRYLQLPHSTLGLASLFTVLAVGAQAATFSVIPLDGDSFFQAPDDLLVDHLITGTGIVSNHAAFNERDVRSSRLNAQTFTAGSDFTVDKIAINYFLADTAGSWDATFQFFAVDVPDASTLPASPTLIDSLVFSAGDVNVSAGTMVFDIADTALTEGSSFAIRVVTASSSTIFKWAFADPFDNARRYEGNSLNSNNEDYTIGLVGAATIPEPSSAALLTGGMVSLLALLRRRRR
ncbi:MAG: PEP-CTERM sorting domain-containing protein [Verrucomicrobiota bacterium]